MFACGSRSAFGVLIVIVVLGLTISLSGCSMSPVPTPPSETEPGPGVGTPEAAEDANFVLYVSNQSFDRSPVDITVTVDDETVVDGDFAVGDQHDWKRYAITLSPGRHTLVATSIHGEATFEHTFETDGDHWAAVEYWYATGADGTPSGPQFSWLMQDTPIQFQ